MKNLHSLILFIALISVGFLIGQPSSISFAERWKTVDSFAAKNLPESALKEVALILDQAKKTHQEDEFIKALIYKMRFTLEKNPNEAPILLKEFESYCTQFENPATQALLHSMTAELYLQYFRSHQWDIIARTEIKGIIPEDIHEWTRNLYFDKIIYHLDQSMSNPLYLQKIPSSHFEKLLHKGEDSKLLQPTLFDFIGQRCIQILQQSNGTADTKNPLNNPQYFSNTSEFISLPNDSTFNSSIENHIIHTYQQLLKYNLNNNNVAACMQLDLDRLEYMLRTSEYSNTDSLYISALQTLENRHIQNEYVVEVMAKEAEFYLRHTQSPYFRQGIALHTEITPASKRRAFDICTRGIQLFPRYNRIDLLKNIQKEITSIEVHIQYPQSIRKGGNPEIEITSQNTSNLTLNVYKLNCSAEEYRKFNEKKSNQELFPHKTRIDSRTISIQNNKDFGQVKSKVQIAASEYGIYEFTLEDTSPNSDKQKISGSFTVTDMAYIYRATTPGQQNLYALDRTSGHPMPQVSVNVFNAQWNGNGYSLSPVAQATTNKDGFCQYPYQPNYYQQTLSISKGEDHFFTSNTNPYFFETQTLSTENAEVSLFTDRALYRPGQTIWFKGIAYYSNSRMQKTDAGSEYTIQLFDVNHQLIKSQTLKTNEYGSFTGNFVLPQSGLNGAYQLQVNGFSQSIWVEEYKRPSFNVELQRTKAELHFNQTVVIRGKATAFAGYPVTEADISYRVVRRIHPFCGWRQEPETQILSGSTQSNHNGEFDIQFAAQRSGSTQNQAYSYTVYVKVTDLKGESQQNEISVPISDQSLFIIANIPDKVDKKEIFQAQVATMSIDNEKLIKTLHYTLERLEPCDDYYDESIANPKAIESVLQGDFNTQKDTLSLNLDNLVSGLYRLTLSTRDEAGKEIKEEKKLVLYDLTDKRPPVKTYLWLQSRNTECKVGDTAHIAFGTSTFDTFVLYELMQGNHIIESYWIPFSNEIKTFDIPFKETYGAGITAQFLFMKEDKLFTQSIQISRKQTERKLTPTLSSFRDKLKPGDKTEWTIIIPELKSLKSTGELMVDMYDAALDNIQPNSWTFNPDYRETTPYSPTWRACDFRLDYNSFTHMKTMNPTQALQTNELNWFGLNMDMGYTRTYDRLPGKAVGQSAPMLKSKKQMQADNETTFSQEEITRQPFGPMSVNDVVPGERLTPKPRTNFNETAFFYPQLHTDSMGSIRFSFTAPESLSRWNIKMLAHTNDLYYGQSEKQVVTQKELMVQMNLPRFVRQSDQLLLNANIINLTDKAQKVNIHFELIDPENNTRIKTNCDTNDLQATTKEHEYATKQVTLLAHETQSVSWKVNGFAPYELVICKVVASSDQFSDGEQKYLPVLRDKVLVTESMPLTIRNNQTRKFSIESILAHTDKKETKNLTLEFASNPIWYAVQALPTTATPQADDALSILTAYYASTLATYIANSNPKLSVMFNRWKNESGSREALLSNLQKNQDLKNILLEETPWVLEAKNENEQKQQLGLLLDLNYQAQQANQQLKKLLQLQAPSGGFSWFQGMPENSYITSEIMLHIGRLLTFTSKNVEYQPNKELQASIKNALKYLDTHIANDYKQLTLTHNASLKEKCIDDSQLFYLYIRTEFPQIPVNDFANDAVKFYLTQTEKYRNTFSLYGKAMATLILSRNGKEKAAKELLQSLEETAIKSNDLGMYWARNTTGYQWNEHPIHIQSVLIEAFEEVNPQSTAINELKIWLLKQKQTQQWDNPLSSANAIYSLLTNNSDWLSNPNQTIIKVDGVELTDSSKEAGTGYFKKKLTTTDHSIPTEISVSHSGKSIGWGGLYWQYAQNQAQIESQSGPLKISKALYVATTTSSGTKLYPLKADKLKKGDKVVTRLVISTNRDLDFVGLQDSRAACFEPTSQQSGTIWNQGLQYYQTTKDASTRYFFQHLPKGNYVFEYESWVNNSGTYSSGIADLQCLYAPEFNSHSSGSEIRVE